MRDIHVERRPIEKNDYKNRHATESDCKQVIEGPCRIFVDGKLSVVLTQAPVETQSQAVSVIKNWTKSPRGSGMITESRIFGFQPRLEARARDYCSIASMARDCTAASYLLMNDCAKQADAIYREQNPEQYANHRAWVDENIHPEWTMANTVFTSGVVNKSCSMAYHRDVGNYRGAWSCMFVVKRHMEGANLCVADFDAKIILPHGSVLLFDGQSLMHGVTPLKKTRGNGDRYSLVFYTLQMMQYCLPPKEELERAKIIRTQREMRKAGLLK